ncbi:hypothetical protein DVU_1162 [Nitratidesulfovibrio vulgaris str. Hildenborough]|uniref:Uncharacterized protein n=1 Tax=Nitratidesulfovibrio vulgaris (strain ATCC 29579 / DSM 644 / CCUG 34227 / NCIMB 8303 / VKM B-1760 / Hildenborough) TaxID=882 RepID=Q72CX1_NITV2|nr:hypothetical protein DVU_1162 [Nitratidesulfovibrio vulgaris str. Hildenborough]ADP86236.1 hypothetical protein Deval_1075 [Nitratidesulfovibrio vulgaris RCH1]
MPAARQPRAPALLTRTFVGLRPPRSLHEHNMNSDDGHLKEHQTLARLSLFHTAKQQENRNADL